MSSTEKYIDIDKVLDSKNPALRKWIPRFVLKYFKRLLHEDEINGVMSRIGHLHGLDFLEAMIVGELNTTVKLEGAENIPKEKGVIIASNHPLGGLDGMTLIYAVGQVRPDIKFLVNDVLLNIENLKQFFVPVNKFGGNPREASKLIEEAYSADIATLVFPSGLVSRKQPQGIEDLEWKKSFVSKAIKYKKDIVPTFIDGQNSRRFYNFSRFRGKIGIKANLEMMLLPGEMFRQRNHTITVKFSDRISYESLDKSKTHQQWADDIRGRVYAMKQS